MTDSPRRDPDGNTYIVRGYTDEMAGSIIPPEMVVGAANGRWWDGDDPPASIKILSTARCPTYGLCDMCLGSGPSGMHCQECRKPDRYYNFVFGSRQKIIDATWISRFFETTHMEARADRTWCWKKEPCTTFSNTFAEIKIGLKYSETRHPGTNEERRQLRLRDLTLFSNGLAYSSPGPWDVLDREVRLLDPFSANLYLGN